ncbi:hypothetical protein [Clostridium sp. YIM B02500]|jgi:hypothetical protein|uniref:hypothetical protein n=1 Tax=Clostridium sp. YIM B02500 TaxID=2910681 RepID=UPI001EEEABC6|nr:hypothetical protein [Clostridium sp. YIM B02500]
MKNNALILTIIGGITLIGNWISFKVSPIDSILGMIILIIIALVGVWLSKIIPIKVESPTVIWVSVLALLLTSPIFPGHETISQFTDKINFMALTTPVLTYAGLSVGKDINTFKKLGIRIVIVSLLVYTGTFLLASIFAEIVLRFNGTI